MRYLAKIYFYHLQRSCGKAIFLHLSVSHSIHGGVCHTHPLDRQIPLGQTLLGRPSWADTHLGRHHPGQTPPSPGQTPPMGRHHLWADTPPAQCMLVCGQQARGTYPTGMHTCLLHEFLYRMDFKDIHFFVIPMSDLM